MALDYTPDAARHYRSMAYRCGTYAAARNMEKNGYPVSVAVLWLATRF